MTVSPRIWLEVGFSIPNLTEIGVWLLLVESFGVTVTGRNKFLFL